MTDLDRRHVKPAHPKATIPDPDHRCALPPDGYPVVWSPYWERLLARQDIVVVDEAPDGTAQTERPTEASGSGEPTPASGGGAPAAEIAPAEPGPASAPDASPAAPHP